MKRAKMPSFAGKDGSGFVGTIQTGSVVLVAWFAEDDDGFVVTSYMMDAPDGKGPVPMPPGDMAFRGKSGSHLLMSQSGVFDVLSDPWCRWSMLPSSQTMRVHARNMEMHFSPLSTFRSVQDTDTKSQFVELFVNSAFMGREGDEYADVQTVWGNSTESPSVHPTNPRSPFLFFRRTESRRPNNGEPLRRTVREEGDVAGRALKEVIDNLVEKTGVSRETGHFSGGQDGAVLEKTTWRLADGESTLTYEASGRITLSTPTWTIDLDADGKGTVSNQDTEILIDKGEIHVGGQSKEPIPLGKKLESRIKALETWAETHIHTHPMGPTATAVPPPTKLPAFLSDKNFVT